MSEGEGWIQRVFGGKPGSQREGPTVEELTERDRLIAEKQQVIVDLELRIGALDTELGARAQQSQAREAEVSRQLDDAATAHDALAAELERSESSRAAEFAQARRQLDSVQAVLQGVREELTQMKGRLAAREVELTRKTEQLTDSEWRNQTLEGEASRLRSEEAKQRALKSSLSALQRDLEAARTERDRRDATIVELHAAERARSEQIQELQATERARSEQIQELQATERARAEQVQELQAAERARAEQIRELEGQLVHSTRRQEALGASIASSEQRLRDREARLAQLQAALFELSRLSAGALHGAFGDALHLAFELTAQRGWRPNIAEARSPAEVVQQLQQQLRLFGIAEQLRLELDDSGARGTVLLSPACSTTEMKALSHWAAAYAIECLSLVLPEGLRLDTVSDEPHGCSFTASSRSASADSDISGTRRVARAS